MTLGTEIYGQEIWGELVRNLLNASENVANFLNSENGIINPSPLRPAGLNESELKFWRSTLPALLQNDGRGFIRMVDALNNRMFPWKDSFITTLIDLLNNVFLIDPSEMDMNMIRIQRSTIREFILFIIAPSTKSVLRQEEQALLNKILEAFKSSKYLTISESTIRNLFRGKTTKNIEKMKNIHRHLHLKEFTQRRKDPNTGNYINAKYYRFSDEILNVLVQMDIVYQDGEKYEIKNNSLFDMNLFSAIILSDICYNERNRLNDSLKIGISTQIALLFMLASQSSITNEFANHSDNSQILEYQGFHSGMEIIPKSWVFDETMEIYAVPLIKCISYIVGGPAWYNIIDRILKNQIQAQINQEVLNPEEKINLKKLLKQLATRVPSINQWKLGEKVRVNIPILVEVENLLTDITSGIDRE